MSPLGTYLVETMITLAGVICLAVLVLWGGRRLGVGRSSGALELLGKLPLDPRRAVYLVRVGKLVYVVAASEGGVVRLGELEASDVSQPEAGPTAGGQGGAGQAGPGAPSGDGGSRGGGFRSVLD